MESAPDTRVDGRDELPHKPAEPELLEHRKQKIR